MLPITPSPSRQSPMRARRLGGQTPSTVDREQAMRDYKLSIEYKHLKSHCPGGVFIVPSLDDVRLFHGVIFIRRGVFTNAIFKFTITCPPQYNDTNTHPKVVFSSYVYNPFVHPETGEVFDLKIPYPEWIPHKHFLVTALTYIKKIFYIKDFSDLSEEAKLKLPNQDAYNKFLNDQEGYRRRVAECVKEAQRSTYTSIPGSTIRFTEETMNHQIMRDLLAERFGANDDDEANNTSFDSSASSVVTKEGVLESIQRAQAGMSSPKTSPKLMPRTTPK